MKKTTLTISRPPLLAELSAIGNAVERKTTIPVLGYVLFDWCDGWLTLTATDLDVTAISKIQISNLEVGRICLHFEPLKKFLASLDGDEIMLEIGENVTCRQGKIRLKIQSLPSDDFPDVARVTDTPLSIKASDLREAVKLCAPFSSAEESRYALQAILLEQFVDSFRFVATDRAGLIVADLGKVDDKSEPISKLPIIAEHWRKIANICAGETVCFGLGKKAESDFALFVCDHRQVIARPVAGTFPNYRLISYKTPDSMKFNRDAFTAAIKRAASSADAIKLSAIDGELTIETDTYQEQIFCQLAGQSFCTKTGAAYLLKALPTLGDSICLTSYRGDDSYYLDPLILNSQSENLTTKTTITAMRKEKE